MSYRTKPDLRTTCPGCGQIIRSPERLGKHKQHKGEPSYNDKMVGHETRCNGDQRWKKKFRAEMARKSKPQLFKDEAQEA